METMSKITVTESVEITVVVTATVREWKLLLREVGSGYPAWKLGDAIRESVRRVEDQCKSPILEVKD